MTQDEFNQLKGIAMEMKVRGQSELIAKTLIDVAEPSKGVTIAQPCAQTPIVPYAATMQDQPTRRPSEVEP